MNASTAYHSLELPWTVSAADERRFRNILWVVLALSIAAGAIVPWIHVPELAREEAEALPPRLAKLIIEKKQEPPPPPVEEVKKEEEPKPEEKKPEEKKKDAARKKAEKSGLMAMRKELDALRKNPALESLKKNTALLLGGQQAITNQRSVITSNVSRGSGGVKGAGINRNIGIQSLASVATTQLESPIGEDVVAAADSTSARKKARTIEEIQLVFDRNKGAVFSLYHRALRTDPSLQGQVVLEITVTPTGEVADCRVVSSDLAADEFLRKLVARVKLFDFGARDVDTMIVTYPIDFLPSS